MVGSANSLRAHSHVRLLFTCIDGIAQHPGVSMASQRCCRQIIDTLAIIITNVPQMRREDQKRDNEMFSAAAVWGEGWGGCLCLGEGGRLCLGYLPYASSSWRCRCTTENVLTGRGATPAAIRAQLETDVS